MATEGHSPGMPYGKAPRDFAGIRVSWDGKALDFTCLWVSGPPASVARSRLGRMGVGGGSGALAVSMHSVGRRDLQGAVVAGAGAIALTGDVLLHFWIQTQIRDSVGEGSVGTTL